MIKNKRICTTITTTITTSAFSSVISWLAIIASPESVLSKLMFLVTVKLRTLGKVAVVAKRAARAPVFHRWNQLSISLCGTSFFSPCLLFSESSFMGVQTPECIALIDQPIETLDQWSQSTITPWGPCLTRQPIKNYGPALHILGRGGEKSSALPFFDWWTTW